MARRRSNPFSLSFLDCMCCGFGSVILMFMIISHRITTHAAEITQVRDVEVLRLAARVDMQRDLLSEREQHLDEVARSLADSDEQLRSQQERLREAAAELARARAESRRRAEAVRKTQAKRQSEPPPTPHVREVLNRGNRQYLTGLRMGGKHALIMVDKSASMLDRTIVNVLIRRNMTEAQRRKAPKWMQVVSTVDWLTANLNPEGWFQIYTFDEEARPVLEGTRAEWIAVGDGRRLDEAMARLERVVPEGGTSLSAAFAAIGAMQPRPDEVYLLVDGLPTVGSQPGRSRTVSGKQRIALFERAVRNLPGNVPVNVILYAFEGDPDAASAYWELSILSGGSFMSPSEHWP
jgi:multidrug efflux pump subunit AcrA (membrane-fusion protein)